MDPKGEAGKQKDQLQLIPPAINVEMAKALAAGAAKYGPWNWRTDHVEMMTYIGAIRRHLDAVLSREDLDPESGAHHLGHVAASCAIVLDAMQHGSLIDNRPPAKLTEHPPSKWNNVKVNVGPIMPGVVAHWAENPELDFRNLTPLDPHS